MRSFLLLSIVLMIVCFGNDARAQRNPAQRYEIDAKRVGVDPNSDDALPRSREFLRIDSTYYVGWLFEGVYKYNHAADYAGFKNAAIPLERALATLERDYHKQLFTHSNTLVEFAQAIKYQADYTLIGRVLLDCYANTERSNDVVALLRRTLHWNFQRDIYLDVYNFLGWTVHRNRFYTHDKYPFLLGSIDENEALANRYLDSGLARLEHFRPMNAIFPPGYYQEDQLKVYHYKSVLFSYALNKDSAEYYFGKLRNTLYFPYNNYGNFLGVMGDFKGAAENYVYAAPQDGTDKRLKEWAYFSSILDIYKGKPKDGTDLMKDMIRANGTTPGFGWYNIALARTLYYDGQIDESIRHNVKASQFKELHIGTTLGQSHYDFALNLNRLMDKEAQIEMKRFEHSNWWYNPSVLWDMSSMLGDKYLQQFLIINQFALNPERDRVIYKLFSTESVVSWDEIWYLIKDFSTRFFISKYQDELVNDKRPLLKKYFKLFLARLKMRQGNYKDAETILTEAAADNTRQEDFEQLFNARVCEALVKCEKENDKRSLADEWMYKYYITFPQLVPFSSERCNMRLITSGNVDKDVIARLKDCNIHFVDDISIPAPVAYVSFSHISDRNRIEYYVLDKTGAYVVEKQAFSYKKADEAGKSLAYRLFNIGDRPAADTSGKVAPPTAPI